MKDVFITSTVLIAAVLLLRLAFRNTISRRAQYALWAVVLLRLLIPVSLPALRHNVLTAAEPMSRTVTEAVERPVYVQRYASYPREAYTGQDDRHTPGDGEVIIQGEDSYGVVEGDSVVLYRRRVSPAMILTLIWIMGMILMAAWFLSVNLRFARRLRRTRVLLDGAVSRYPVYLCDDIPSPCLFGLLRPSIYLTSESAREEVRLRCIIAHEETHGRHLDPLWSLLRSLCLVIWWFHPLVWAAAYASRADGELACDEGTLARLEEGDRITYGETLLALVPRRGAGTPMLAATTMGAGKGQLRERIRRIAEHKRPLAAALAAALVILAVVCVLTFTGRRDRQEEPRPSASAEPASPADLAIPSPVPTEGPSAQPAETATPAEPSVTPGIGTELVPLTGEELAWFNHVFFAGVIREGTEERINLHNQFLNPLYASPEDIDLFALFYCGTGEKQQPVSPEELELLGFDGECAADKLPAEEMDRVFLDNTGLHIRETKRIGLDQFSYLEDDDAYYHPHGDTNYFASPGITAGAAEENLIHLYYPDYPGGKNWRCVTLRRAGEGEYRFVSNLEAEKPAIPTAYPAEEPWAVIPLDGLTPYTPQKAELTLHRKDLEKRLGSWQVPGMEGILLHYLSTDGNRYFALVRDWRETAMDDWQMEVFLTVPDEMTVVRCFNDLLGCGGVMISWRDRISGAQMGLSCKVYTFDEAGDPVLLADTAADNEDCVKLLDLDGDGTTELITEAYTRSALFFLRDGSLYGADLYTLLLDAIGAEDPYWDYGLIDPDYRCLTVRIFTDTHTVFRSLYRYVYFAGDRLLVYADPQIDQSGHLAAGVAAPAEVLADAMTTGENAVREALEGEYGERIGEWMDDWCVAGLELTRTERQDYAIEAWSLSVLLHAKAPEKVVLAGGMYITEDDWVVGGLWPEPPSFLFYAVTPEGVRTRLEGGQASGAWDMGPENAFGYPATLAYLELLNGLRTPSDLNGAELRRLFVCYTIPALDLLGAAGEEVRTAALETMLRDAAEDPEVSLIDLRQIYGDRAYWLRREDGPLTAEGRAAANDLGELLGG